MTTARSIISGAMTFGLNRLSPGETLDADVAALCLEALNHIADEWNGSKSFLFREIFTVGSALTGTSGTLGTTWSGLVSGDEILGATVLDGGVDIPMMPLSLAQYANIAIKTLSTIPSLYAHDGAATVYIYPAPVAKVITLRTKQVVSDFADLDTDYSMPKGYKSALAALLTEKMAPVLLGSITQPIANAARAARSRVASQVVSPAILSAGDLAGGVLRIKRGY